MSTNLPSSVGEVLQTICVRGFQLSVSYAWALAPRYFIPESWHDKSTAYWQFLLLTQVTSQIFFHTVGLSYTLLDYVLERRGTISKYKIQPEANVPIDWKKYRHVIWIANRNSLVVQAPMSALFSLFFVRLNMDIWPGPLPPVYFTLLRIAAASVVGEFIFYHVHWWMHKGGYYQQLHKMHHEWVAPVAYANVYCTMFEHVFQNVLSIYAGALFCSHIVEVGVLLNLVSLNSFASHSGYKLPIGGNGNHDMHHTNFNVNYGVIMLFDKFYGTFKAVPQEQTLLETATKSPLTLRYSMTSSKAASPKPAPGRDSQRKEE